DWSPTSPDVVAACWSQGYRDIPAGVPRDRVYRLRREPTPAHDAEFQQAAADEAETEGRALLAARGGGPLAPGFVWLLPIGAVGQVVGASAGGGGALVVAPAAVRAAAPVAPGAAAAQGGVIVGGGVAPAAAPAPHLQGPLQGVAPLVAQAGAGTVWRAAETGGGFQFGDPGPGHTRTAQAVGAKDMHILPDGSALFDEEVSPAVERSFFDRGVSGDARIMAVRRNRQGRRERTWAEMVVDVVREFTDDWDLPGPRSTLLCLEFVNQEGLGLDGHRERFRSTCMLESSRWGVSEHCNVTQALKFGLLHDRVDGSNLVMVESLLRRLQTIEFAHSERAREQEAKGHGGKLSLEEQMACAGTSRAGGSLMICPLLLDHVRSEAWEEREAARTKENNNNKDNV
ncbi:unnamed protein product, partial [Prorocentrum cordatum]